MTPPSSLWRCISMRLVIDERTIATIDDHGAGWAWAVLRYHCLVASGESPDRESAMRAAEQAAGK